MHESCTVFHRQYTVQDGLLQSKEKAPPKQEDGFLGCFGGDP